MNKHLMAMILGAAPLFVIVASANATSGKELGKAATGAPERDAADAYFSKKAPRLTAQEKAALSIAQKWQATSATGMKPVAGNDGMVRFVYGSQQVSVVCAVLKACDIELQPGELVNNLNVGDPRFTVEPAVSGSGATEVQHLILKPQDVGLDTNLIVTTNRRSYQIKLRSHRTDYMARVGFIYPEDALIKWDEIKMREATQKHDKTKPQTKENTGSLSFDYDIKGKAPWKPVRVYNDGVRTVIQMPAAMGETEAPILRLVLKEGGLFSDEVTALPNYRIQDDRYIVDTVFQKAILSAGVGRDQESVIITREK